MDPALKLAIFRVVEKEPFTGYLQIQLVELAKGYSATEMVYVPELMGNIYDKAHGGVILTLIDVAFGAACQTDGTVAVGLNLSVTFIGSPEPGAKLRAEAREIGRTEKTLNYDVKVTDQVGGLIAVGSALAYRTGKPVSFL
ncbi:MAG: PaaI family thioesterase [Syntrophobacteraceae bacterium]